MITFKNYTDKNVIIQDCLTELEPYIDKIIPKEEKIITDCTDVETDIILDNYFNIICA